DLSAVLFKGGECVARLDAAADVDQHPLDTPGALGQDTHLLAGANVATIGQRLLDVAAFGLLGRHWRRRNRRWPRGRRGSGWASAGADQEGAGSRGNNQQPLVRT